MYEDFADVENEPREGSSDFSKITYMKLEDGHKYTIRILEQRARKFFSHFLGGKNSVLCLGDECPICKRTLDLYQQFPDTYRNEKGYNPRQKRFYVNVLDKSLVKKCSKCNKEYTNLNMGICSDCSVALGDPEPSNTVKVLSKGPAVFGQLNEINKAVTARNEQTGEEEPVGIHNYDLDVMVTGKGKETKVTIIPLPHRNAPLDAEYQLFDLTSPLPELTPDEMLDVQRGVSLKDIYAARKAEKDLVAEVNVEVNAALEDEVNEAVNKLFS